MLINHPRLFPVPPLPSVLLPVLLILGFSCANTIPPQGGPRDETPPQLVPEKSTPNYQVNFRQQPIELTFDEWVQLKEPFQQVIVSPPIQGWDLRIKGKTVIFEFPENDTLRANATYTINFGTAIQDLTESNPADLRFVFATGPRLDSLEVGGLIVDAQTGEAVEGVLFMLYESLADTVVRTQRPFYFGKTNKEGRFLISNIRPGVFKGFALKDGNADYKYNQDSETIAFPDSLIVLADSLPRPELRLRLFAEERPLRILDEITEPFGVVKVLFNQPPTLIDWRSDDGPALLPDYERDTLRLWYGDTPAGPWGIVITRDTSLRDTVRVPPRDPERFLASARLKLAAAPGGRLTPGRPFRLRFNHPIASADTALIRLLADTSQTAVPFTVAIDTPSRRDLLLNHAWKEGLTYQVELLPGAVYDIFGLPTRDTIAPRFGVEPRKSFGNLNLTISGLDSTQQYVGQLVTKENQVLEERLISNRTTYQEVFQLLPPGEYVLRLITDRNGNGRWDPGRYDTRRQPEPIFLRPLEQVRANWDIEAQVTVE